jgi:hypothetical protein
MRALPTCFFWARADKSKRPIKLDDEIAYRRDHRAELLGSELR